MRFDLTDQEWAIVEPLLPPTRQGGERRDDRQVINGIFYVLRTGIPWDDLPARYGPHTTAYNRFNRWAKQGIWQRLEFRGGELGSWELGVGVGVRSSESEFRGQYI